MRMSVTGEYRAFNRFCRASAVLLILHGACPMPAEAKRSRRALIKPVQVRAINVDVRNVFDPTVPGEDFWLFRLANTLHIETRDSVIRRELLMRPRQKTDQEQIEESERILRALPFIKDAVISQKHNTDGSVDLLVKTQDAWTTQPQFNISSEGGQTKYSGGFEEVNLLGYGKDLSYFYKKDVDGITHVLDYKDPQFLNTRLKLATDFQDTATGNVQNVTLERPFFSLATPVAGGITVNRSMGLQKIFQGGQQINSYDQNHLNVNPSVGMKINSDPLNVLRTQLSYRYSEDIYRPESVTLPGTLPANKALSGPIVGTSFIQSDFIKETFVDRAGRVEDINLGHEANAGVGYVGRSLGATENSIPFSANDSFGFGGTESWFGLVSFGTSSRYMLYSDNQTGGRLFNTIYFGNLNLYRHLIESFPTTGVIHVESAYLQHPDASNVLALGGDSGLRGYSNNAFTGNKSLLVNLENRFYYPKEILHLAYVGGTAFVDAGQVQPQGLGFDAKNFHVDVGMGMRFGLSRSADGTVFRIDLAYAVGPVQQANRWILSISSAQGFSRSGNSYKNFSASSSTQ